jgi:hypothetical protein
MQISAQKNRHLLFRERGRAATIWVLSYREILTKRKEIVQFFSRSSLGVLSVK